MFKCAPYIKTICHNLGHPGAWWRDGTSSLPASPIRQSWQSNGTANGDIDKSPTRSELDRPIDYEGHSLKVPVRSEGDLRGLRFRDDFDDNGGFENELPTLVATTVVDKDGVVKSEVTMQVVPQPNRLLPKSSDLVESSNKVRPDSPDVTRVAKKLEEECKRGNVSLGAIPKDISRLESPTITTSSSQRYDMTSIIVVYIHSFP